MLSTKQNGPIVSIVFIACAGLLILGVLLICTPGEKEKVASNTINGDTALNEREAFDQADVSTFRSEIKSDFERLRNIKENIKELAKDRPVVGVYDDAIAARLEKRYGRPSTNEEIQEEKRRINEINSLTEEYAFSMKAEALDAMMAKEERNERWETDVNKYLNLQKQNEAVPIPDVREITCTERICRMVFSHDNDEERERFMRDVAMFIGSGVDGGHAFGKKVNSDFGDFESDIYVLKGDDPLILFDVREEIYNKLNEGQNPEQGV